MLPVDLDLSIEFRELTMSRPEELMNGETDRERDWSNLYDSLASTAELSAASQAKLITS